MATDNKNEFLILSLPDKTEVGSNLRLLAIGSSLADARKAVEDLSSNQLGKVAILERRALYIRKAAIESVEVDDKINS